MCDECGFDPNLGNDYDLARGATLAAAEFKYAIAGAGPGVLATRPSETMWSVAEYIDHLALVYELAAAAHLHLHETGEWTSFEAPRFDANAPQPVPAEALQRLEAAQDRLSRVITKRDDETTTTLRRLNHGRVHHTFDVARIRSALEDAAPPMAGEVIQVNSSGGGLPKMPLPSAKVDVTGVTNDVQASRKHHGAPFQALCLFSAEVVDGFAAEGHPISYGSAGENLTLTGIDWSALRSGLEVAVGDVVARLTFPATPCAQNRPWFSDGDFRRLSHDLYPSQSRWYAMVVQGGTVTAGDAVSIASPAFTE